MQISDKELNDFISFINLASNSDKSLLKDAFELAQLSIADRIFDYLPVYEKVKYPNFKQMIGDVIDTILNEVEFKIINLTNSGPLAP